ncbi:hypothetical protein M9458_044300, partial [Cirrhinus mrigala]
VHYLLSDPSSPFSPPVLSCSSGIQADDDLKSMFVGTVMRKIKSRTWKKQRYFRLQEDCMTIWYKSKKAGNAHST